MKATTSAPQGAISATTSSFVRRAHDDRRGRFIRSAIIARFARLATQRSHHVPGGAVPGGARFRQSASEASAFAQSLARRPRKAPRALQPSSKSEFLRTFKPNANTNMVGQDNRKDRVPAAQFRHLPGGASVNPLITRYKTRGKTQLDLFFERLTLHKWAEATQRHAIDMSDAIACLNVAGDFGGAVAMWMRQPTHTIYN